MIFNSIGSSKNVVKAPDFTKKIKNMIVRKDSEINTYTANQDCWVYGIGVSYGAHEAVNIAVNGNTVCYGNYPYTLPLTPFYLKKGDVIKVSRNDVRVELDIFAVLR